MVLLYIINVIITVTAININTIIVADIVMDIIIVYCTNLLDVNLKGIIF